MKNKENFKYAEFLCTTCNTVVTKQYTDDELENVKDIVETFPTCNICGKKTELILHPVLGDAVKGLLSKGYKVSALGVACISIAFSPKLSNEELESIANSLPYEFNYLSGNDPDTPDEYDVLINARLQVNDFEEEIIIEGTTLSNDEAGKVKYIEFASKSLADFIANVLPSKI